MALALARLQQLRHKLLYDSSLHQKYAETVNDYKAKGYAREVTHIDSKSKRVWYLLHHPVINPNKPGKLRVVFDCAAKFQGISLNSQLLQGPDFYNSLVCVFMRFRQEQVALASDVEARSVFWRETVTPYDFCGGQMGTQLNSPDDIVCRFICLVPHCHQVVLYMH